MTRTERFTVVFEKADEGGYIARVPALPGCMTQGETLEEAEAMVKDAIHSYCASLKKNREALPRDIEEVVESISVRVPV
ncbi:MAG: type II toxin-antitoxin system HicB family antitoxin [Elusimicrobia bacterium]|nr:type II toxin-antitoxin system HicB family antitoxin [Elusimicrobiota bacterium]